MILDLVVERALGLPLLGELKVVDAGICYPYTYVAVEGPKGRSLGLALTPLGELGVLEAERPPRAPLDDLEELMSLATSTHMLERALGLAAVNAVSQYHLDVEEAVGSCVLDVLPGPGEVRLVAVVGLMGPLVRRLRERGYEVVVFERDPVLRGRSALPDSLEARLLPGADVVVITGAALLNDTIDMVLEWSRRARVMVLTGATAQQHPCLLEGTGVTHVSSAKVVDVDTAVRLVKLGSWRKGVSPPYSKRYVLRVP